MTPSPAAVAALAAGAGLYWSVLGAPVARRVLPVPGGATLLGWCLHTVAAAVVLPFVGFSDVAVCGLAVALLVVVRVAARGGPAVPGLPVAVQALCAGAAVIPAVALLPGRVAGGGWSLASPIFDHSKVAIIDAVVRAGLPPINPFFETGQPLAYYYWWHLAAAELAAAAHVSGWAADVALTGVTAFATLTLMAGIGFGLAPRVTAPVVAGLAVVFALPASIRPLTAGLERAGWLARATGLGGWLDQVTWAPQHAAAAGGVVLAALMLGWRERRLPVLTLAAVMAAAAGASTWVGGVTAAVALPAAMVCSGRLTRGYVLRGVAAAGLAGLLLVPLLRTEAAAALPGRAVVALAAFPTLGARLPGWLNGAAFVVLLMVEFPLLVLLAPVGLREGLAGRGWARAVAAAGVGGLLVTAGLRSTLENNDLGWRAALPAVLGLTPFAALAAYRLWTGRVRWQLGCRVLVVVAPVLGLIGTVPLLGDLLSPRTSARNLADSVALWRAVRPMIPVDGRVALDPQLDATLTPWPANIGWALLADRSSCYAGWATAHPFSQVPALALYATAESVRAIYATPRRADLAVLARLHCTAALVTPLSRAWVEDPFARAAGWRLIGTDQTSYRLYGVLGGADGSVERPGGTVPAGR